MANKKEVVGQLTITRKENDFLGLMVQAWATPENMQRLADGNMVMGYQTKGTTYVMSPNDFNSFIDKLAKIEHDNDWCTDPDCIVGKK